MRAADEVERPAALTNRGQRHGQESVTTEARLFSKTFCQGAEANPVEQARRGWRSGSGSYRSRRTTGLDGSPQYRP